MAWLEEAVKRFGESRITPPEDGVILRGESGHYIRRAWVWFPESKNHNVHIDRYSGFYEIGVGGPGRNYTVRQEEEPTDAQMIDLMNAVWGKP